MKTPSDIARYVFGGMALLFASFLLYQLWGISMLGTGMSEIRGRVDVPSPDGRYIASGYHLSGGATVMDATIVTIRPKDRRLALNDEKVFSVDMNIRDNSFLITWTDNHNLKIKYADGPNCFQRTIWNDVRITSDPVWHFVRMPMPDSRH